MAQHEEINEAHAVVWPRVREVIAQRIERNGGRRPSDMNKAIVEQTLWELSRLDRLLTPERAEVIEKARAWREGWGEDPITTEEEDVTEDDVLLYHAIGQLPPVAPRWLTR